MQLSLMQFIESPLSTRRINHSEITIIFLSKLNLEKLLEIAPRCSAVRVIVCLDELDSAQQKKTEDTLKSHNIVLKSLSEREKSFLTRCIPIWANIPKTVEASGKAHPLPPTPAKPSDLATICYSSGTTSHPKGVLLTHWNLTSAAITFSQGLPMREPNTAIISYLPLAHIVGRVIELTAFLIGLRIGYYTGDPLRLIEDIAILKPAVLPAVPRILNRIAGKIQAARAESGLKGEFFILRFADNVHLI